MTCKTQNVRAERLHIHFSRARGLRRVDDQQRAGGGCALLGEHDALRVERRLQFAPRIAEVDDLRARFDLSVLNDTHYYNGLVFRGYARGAADKILSGGRYDRLVRRMGRPGGAVGFAVYLGLLPSSEASDGKGTDADVLVLYDDGTPLTEVRRRCDALRAEGKRVSTQRSPDDSLRVSEILDLRQGGESHA